MTTKRRSAISKITSSKGQMISKSDLSVREVPSKGLSSRVRGLTTTEIHHLFSNLERKYYYCLLWSHKITEIKTQQLLPMDLTTEISTKLGLKHPINPKTKDLKPVSSDFVISVLEEGVSKLKVRSVKPESELNR